MSNFFWSLLLVGLCCSPITASAQISQGQTLFSIAQDDEDYDDEEEWRGFAVGLNINAYLANKKAAQFYNGTCNASLDEGLGRCYTIEERLSEELFFNDYTQILNSLNGPTSFRVPRDAYPGNVRYSVTPSLGLHMRYTFNRRSALFTDVNVMRLRTVDQFTIVTDLLPDNGQGAEDIRSYTISGREDRFQMVLGYHTCNPLQGDMNWYFDVAAGIIGVKPLEHQLEIEGRTLDLFLQRIDQNNFQTFQVPRTSVGRSIVLGTGIEFLFQENYFMNVGIQGSWDKVKLGTFEENLINWAATVRFAI